MTDGMPPPTLHVGLMASEKAAPLLAGAETGAFARHGLAVDFTVLDSAVARDAAFADGELDVVVMNLVSAVGLHLRGIGVRVLTKVLDAAGPDGMFRVLAGPGRSAAPRPTVGTSQGTIADFSVSSLLRRLGMDRTRVTVVDIPDIRIRSRALVDGTVAWAVLPEPAGAWCLERGCVVLADDRGSTPPGPTLCMADGPRALPPEIAAPFLAAVGEGVRALGTTPSSALDTLVAHGIDAGSSWSPPSYRVGELPSVDEIADVLRWMAEMRPPTAAAERQVPSAAEVHRAMTA